MLCGILFYDEVAFNFVKASFSPTVKKKHVAAPFLLAVLHSRWLCVLCLAPLVKPSSQLLGPLS